MRPTTLPARRARKNCTSTCLNSGFFLGENASCRSASRCGMYPLWPANRRLGRAMKALRSDLPSTGVTTTSEEAMTGSSYHGGRDRAVEHQHAVRLAARAIGFERANLQPELPAVA